MEPMGYLKFRLTYETGEVKLIDVSPYDNGSCFGELKGQGTFSLTIFAKIYVYCIDEKVEYGIMIMPNKVRSELHGEGFD